VHIEQLAPGREMMCRNTALTRLEDSHDDDLLGWAGSSYYSRSSNAPECCLHQSIIFDILSSFLKCKSRLRTMSCSYWLTPDPLHVVFRLAMKPYNKIPPQVCNVTEASTSNRQTSVRGKLIPAILLVLLQSSDMLQSSISNSEEKVRLERQERGRRHPVH
jgi:hypothetical protein